MGKRSGIYERYESLPPAKDSVRVLISCSPSSPNCMQLVALIPKSPRDILKYKSHKYKSYYIASQCQNPSGGRGRLAGCGTPCRKKTRLRASKSSPTSSTLNSTIRTRLSIIINNNNSNNNNKNTDLKFL